MPSEFRIKRIYDEPTDDDGYRILVDRLWPRGIAKASARIDLWPKEFTPSTELRKWFHANPNQYDDFVSKYFQELEEQQTEVKRTIKGITQSTITLVTAVKDPERSHAVVLQKFLIKLISDET